MIPPGQGLVKANVGEHCAPGSGSTRHGVTARRCSAAEEPATLHSLRTVGTTRRSFRR
jgi:hypothetical protein